ncbi:MAG: putative metalloprotease CJM1_0395 family protein [Gammaproteobacteria bacterium]|nr:putative metalloprotease CJM1_0395 family protein [Gammaproteobacteria bacterium]MDH3767146.1 putative metalloprotease CJM1_0395 family protein [Gammaproteobacteria bacterium]
MNPGVTTQVTSQSILLPVRPASLPAVSGVANDSRQLVRRAAAEPELAARARDADDGGRPVKPAGQIGEYTPQEHAELRDLRARDREVRAHELAHLAAAGAHARGGANFTYKPGPDGRRYAVAGEVSIDTSEVAGDPAATLTKAKQIRRAALAPAEPSAQDRRIATQASAMATKASSELAQQRRTPESNSAHAVAIQAYTTSDNEASLIELVA